MASYIANRALDRMTCMVDADLVWIVHLDLVTAWLEDLGSLASKVCGDPSLPAIISLTRTI